MATPILGIGSNIDLNSLVSGLLSAERAPKESQLKRQESAATTKISALGQLRSGVSDFQASIKALNSLSQFEKRSAVSSDTKAITASASTSASGGVFALQVEQLAAASKVALRSVAGGVDASFSTGTLRIDNGSGSPVSVVVRSENNTLAGIRDAINVSAKGLGVSANIVTDASGSRLVLSSDKTGAGKDISISVTDSGNGGSNGLSLLAFDQAALPSPAAAGEPRVLVAAQNAKFSVDGLAVESATNVASGVIDGVEITLLAAQTQEERDNGKTITLTVDQDRTGVKNGIKKFVDAYNKLVSTTSQLTVVTSVGEGKAPSTGALVGDASVRNLISTLRQEMTTVSAGGGDFRLLAEMGISTQKDGTLKIDDAKLDKALKDGYDDVARFFAGDNGLMTRLDARLNNYSKSDGILDTRIKGLQKSLTSVDTQREALERRMESYEAQLIKQFTAMDSLVSRLNQTSNALTSALASLPGMSDS